MIKSIVIILSSIALLSSCYQGETSYSDEIPLEAEEFWPDKFRGLQLLNFHVYKDRLYGNTVNIPYADYLYCLNLKNGKINWRADVSNYASQQVTELNDTVFYCSFLGDMQTFNSSGVEIWNEKYTSPYGGHWLDTTNSMIYFCTVSGDKTSTYGLNGGLYDERESNSLKWKIKKKRKYIEPIDKQYQINNNGWTYLVNISIGEYLMDYDVTIVKIPFNLIEL